MTYLVFIVPVLMAAFIAFGVLVHKKQAQLEKKNRAAFEEKRSKLNKVTLEWPKSELLFDLIDRAHAGVESNSYRLASARMWIEIKDIIQRTYIEKNKEPHVWDGTTFEILKNHTTIVLREGSLSDWEYDGSKDYTKGDGV